MISTYQQPTRLNHPDCPVLLISIHNLVDRSFFNKPLIYSPFSKVIAAIDAL